ncbi:MAG: aldose 1-epimerase [Alphaproteobacteria bacterium]|nr:aldose 1-epimerase [Alphaproteobacteria bacterium]
MNLLSLRAGRLALDLAPDCGGSIARFAVEGKGDLLRPTPIEALISGKGNNTACYPLVPYSNRIADGLLRFDGETYMLAANWPGQRHAMHGDGWSRAWTVARSDAQSATLVYEHDGLLGWPFRYRAVQSFHLDNDRLDIAMRIENLERHAVPAGLGLHPFFVRDTDSELSCRTTGVWLTDTEVIPTEHVPVPPSWDFSRSRRVDDVVLDNCFDGWDGRAVVRWPSRGLAVDLSATKALRHLVIFTPPRRPFFCVEPVSHASGAIARMRLDAGATLSGEIALSVAPP